LYTARPVVSVGNGGVPAFGQSGCFSVKYQVHTNLWIFVWKFYLKCVLNSTHPKNTIFKNKAVISYKQKARRNNAGLFFLNKAKYIFVIKYQPEIKAQAWA